MNSDEIDPDAVSHDATEGKQIGRLCMDLPNLLFSLTFLVDPIVIENGTFAWEPDTITLRDIDLRVKEGQLVAVVGTVGAGKSTLLSAILGELDKLNGRVNTKVRVRLG